MSVCPHMWSFSLLNSTSRKAAPSGLIKFQVLLYIENQNLSFMYLLSMVLIRTFSNHVFSNSLKNLKTMVILPPALFPMSSLVQYHQCILISAHLTLFSGGFTELVELLKQCPEENKILHKWSNQKIKRKTLFLSLIWEVDCYITQLNFISKLLLLCFFQTRLESKNRMYPC